MTLSNVQLCLDIPKSLSGQALTYLSNSKWCNPDNSWLNAPAGVPRLIIGFVAIPAIAAVGAVYHALAFLGCCLQGKGTRAIQHLGSMWVDIFRCLPGPASLIFMCKPSLYVKQGGCVRGMDGRLRPAPKQVDPRQVELAIPFFFLFFVLAFFPVFTGGDGIFCAIPYVGSGSGDIEMQKSKKATAEGSNPNPAI